MEKILKYFSENKLILNLLVIIIVVLGIFSFANLKKDFMPAIESDYMLINVAYPGASAKDVEMNVVVPIEEKLDEISGIEEYTSLSVDGSATVYITLDPDLGDVNATKDEIFRNISKEKIPDIPDEVEDIIVVDKNPKIMPIYEIGISPVNAEEMNEKELYAFADKLENFIKKIKGVNNVSKLGYKDREIHINVHPVKMADYYISFNNVINSIKVRNVRSTGGTLQSIEKEQNIITIGEFKNPMDVKNVIIRSNFEKKKVVINDIASVADGFKKTNLLVRVNQEKAVILSITKNENADIVKTAKRINKFINEYSPNNETGFKITKVMDRSSAIESLLGVVSINAFIGFIIVVLVLFVFLNIRISFWTAMGIPLSLFITSAYMLKMDFTLNVMTLGAIITVLGMMVDHGIVIAESIHTNRSRGMSPLEASVKGVRSVFSPVIVSVMTTIVAFLPLLAIKGMMGKIIFMFPVIVAVALLASIFEAVIILPGHLNEGKGRKAVKDRKEKWFMPAMYFYEKILGKVLKRRYLALLIFILIFIVTLAVSWNPIKNFVLIWDDSAEVIKINLEAEKGTSLEKTEKLAANIEGMVYKIIEKDKILSMVTNTGHHNAKFQNQGYHENWTQVVITLVPKTKRKLAATQYIKKLRKKINKKKTPFFKNIFYMKTGIGPSAGKAIDIKIVGNDIETSRKLMKEIENFLSGIKGVKDLDNDQKSGKEELLIKFNYAKLAQLGLTVSDVALAVRTAYDGIIATSVQTIDKKIDFRVKIDNSYQRSRKFLLNLLVSNNDGRLIKLGKVASIKNAKGVASINHFDGDRVITILGNVEEDIITAKQVNKLVVKKFKDVEKRYPGTYLRYGGEIQKTKESMGGVASAFIIAVILIYLIVFVLFRSFVQPLLILAIVPFGLTGALLALAAHGIPLSLFAIVGMIGLSGVVVNDCIIMIDFINKIFKENSRDRRSIEENIINGSKERFRPVVLTTTTTVAALIPTAYGFGGSVGILVPTVMTMVYGLLFASLLTLFLIPSLYMIHYDIKLKLKKIFQN